MASDKITRTAAVNEKPIVRHCLE